MQQQYSDLTILEDVLMPIDFDDDGSVDEAPRWEETLNQNHKLKYFADKVEVEDQLER